MAVTRRATLSEKSRIILRAIADGQSYAQIVDSGRGFTYRDIFAAAEDALAVTVLAPGYKESLAAIKEAYPRAYETWSEEEEESLRRFHGEGYFVKELAARLQRQPSAIQSRLKQLGLWPENGPS